VKRDESPDLAADLSKYFAEYLLIRLSWRICLGSAGTLGCPAAFPEVNVRRPALKTTFLETPMTRSADDKRPLSLFFHFGNSMSSPLGEKDGI
jgi:hypothetical protein